MSDLYTVFLSRTCQYSQHVLVNDLPAGKYDFSKENDVKGAD